ncbi:MAG: caspase family protein [Kovacikia sp.]
MHRKKIALLIGVSEYGDGFDPLPATRKDVEALQRLLQDAEIGGFDQVTPLINPTLAEMQEKIDMLFRDCTSDDLVLLYFSGHGIIDGEGLYFTTRETRKLDGNPATWTAVPATFVRGRMSTSRSRQKVMIIDCCYSGAIKASEDKKGEKGEKGDESINFKEQLMDEVDEGRVILTSSSKLETSHGTSESGLSLYTHHLVKGIESGEADHDRDGKINVQNLFDYVKRQLKGVNAEHKMSPQIFSEQEGGKIVLAHVPSRDPESVYGRQVDRLIQQGEISIRGRKSFYAHQILTLLQKRLRLYAEEAKQVERNVLRPYQKHHRDLQTFRIALRKVPQKQRSKGANKSDSSNEQHLLHLQQELKLSDADVEQIKLEVRASAGYRKRSRRIALAVLGAGTTACIAATGILASRIYTQWSLPQTVVEDLDLSYQSISQTGNQLRFQLAQQISADSLRGAVADALEAEQAMQEAKTHQDWHGAVPPWSKAVKQLETAIAKLDQDPDPAQLAKYRQYLSEKKSEADDALAFAQAIAPAFEAWDRKQKPKPSIDDHGQVADFLKRAIARMEAIPPSSRYHGDAQEKLPTYKNWLHESQKLAQ